MLNKIPKLVSIKDLNFKYNNNYKNDTIISNNIQY
jgi:hypothetical protein